MECIYYTDSLISDSKTLSKLCILFDSVSTFTLSPAYYLDILQESWKTGASLHEKVEKDLISRLHLDETQKFLENNHELCEANILKTVIWNQPPPDWKPGELYGRDILTKESHHMMTAFGKDMNLIPRGKGYVDTVWYVYNRWISLYAGIVFSLKSGLVPISDNPKLSRIACDLHKRHSIQDYKPSVEEIASNLAFHSLSLSIPDFPSLHPQEILEVRFKLDDELNYFKNEMRQIAKNVSLEEYDNITILVREKVQPHLNDIKLKIKSINDDLFRKISSSILIGSGATTLLSEFLSLPTSGKVASLATFFGKMLLDLHEYQSKKHEILNQSENKGFVFLLDIEKRYK